MYYDEDSNHNADSAKNNVGKARETLTYAEAQRMIEVEIAGVIHRININEPMNIISLDPQSNKSDKLALESYQTPEIYSNHSEHTFMHNNHVSSTKKSTKKGRSSVSSKTKESSTIKSSSSLSSSTKNHVNSDSINNKNKNNNHDSQQIKIPEPSFRVINNRKPIKAPPRPISYYRYIDKSSEELDETVEYDMDEEDFSWLELINKKRQKDNLSIIPADTFELLMDRLEKECYFLNQTNGNGDAAAIDEDAVCCICNDGK